MTNWAGTEYDDRTIDLDCFEHKIARFGAGFIPSPRDLRAMMSLWSL